MHFFFCNQLFIIAYIKGGSEKRKRRYHQLSLKSDRAKYDTKRSTLPFFLQPHVPPYSEPRWYTLMRSEREYIKKGTHNGYINKTLIFNKHIKTLHASVLHPLLLMYRVQA